MILIITSQTFQDLGWFHKIKMDFTKEFALGMGNLHRYDICGERYFILEQLLLQLTYLNLSRRKTDIKLFFIK